MLYAMYDKEQEDEAREKKRLEKKAREKEAAYQERLRNWESRERRKAKEYEKERERERCREEEREKEAKRLKEFLEDYDDERDDHKYYKGKELQRRLGLRVREAEADARERAREAEELEALRARVWGSRPPDDPGARAAYERARAALDAQYRPRLLIDVSLQHDQQRAQELQRAERREEARREARERAARERERYLRLAAVRQLPREASPIESSSSGAASPPPAAPPRAPRLAAQLRPRHHPAAAPHAPPPRTCKNADTFADHKVIRNRTVTSTGSSPITISFKNHHKLSPSANDTPNESGRVRRVHAAFAGDDDEPTGGPPHGGHPPSHGAPPSHGTPTGGHTHDQPRPKEKKDKSKKGSSGAANAEAAAGDKENRSAEEKRKHIKSLIDKIPTQKDQLLTTY
ncbi:hypothetical protein SFRURICE_000030 [Spodoptera frugiperda]|nr:hypothetical protein SFRURICE_000030 [Spodoptera frugiperda]